MAMSSVSSTVPTNIYGYLQVPNIGVAQTNDPSLVQAATSLSEEAGVLSSLDGASSSSDAVGMLSSFVQPYSTNALPTPTPGTAAAEGLAVQGSTDQTLLGSSSTDPLLNAVYSASGSIQSSGSMNTSSWATVVQGDPNAATAMTNDAVDQSIVSQLSAYA